MGEEKARKELKILCEQLTTTLVGASS